MMLKNWTVFDIECDGFDPTKIYCLSFETSSGLKGSLSTYDEIIFFLKAQEVLVGHNIVRFDVPVLERILGVEVKAELVDTLFLSWTLLPQRKKDFGLADFGEDYGIEKPKIDDWFGLEVEQYIHRCEEDVKINVHLWRDLVGVLIDLYDTQEEAENYIRYITFKARCARLQEESKWRIDVKMVSEKLQELRDEKEQRFRDLSRVMPKVPALDTRSPPKRMFKANGELSEHGKKWQEFLIRQGLPLDHDEPVEYIHHFDDPNPNSTKQVKDWLYSLGWVPRTFKYDRDKSTGEIREIPQINQPNGAGICDSIVDLYDVCPEFELLDRYGALSHRIGLLKGFLRDVNKGFLTARMAGLTNTLRFKHAEVVNLPKPEKVYAEPVRSAFIAREGYELCGSDQKSLEDKIKQHFIYDYDPDYVNEMNKEDYDPHLALALLGEAVTKEEVDLYKAHDKECVLRIKPIRSVYKNGNYACQYGAGVSRLALTCNISESEARKIHEAYWKMNWAIKAVAEDQIVKTVRGQMWLYNPISGFWYSLRFMKDRFSTLVQGTASFVFDLWVMKILEKREQLTAQFHDEVVLEVLKGFRKECTDLLQTAMDEVNSMLKLNVDLAVDIQFGDRYSEIH